MKINSIIKEIRSTVIHWLVEISHELCVDESTLFKSVKLLNMYMIDLRNTMGKPLMGQSHISNEIVMVTPSRIQCFTR